MSGLKIVRITKNIEMLPIDPSTQIQIIHALDDADFEKIFAIREAVFEQELGVEEEAQVDGFDPVSHHYLIVSDNVAAGVARWRVTLGGNIRLERLAILEEYRGKGFGKAIMQRMLADIPQNKTTHVECLSKQAKYFEKFGFVSEEDEFDFQGIPHLRMRLVKPS